MGNYEKRKVDLVVISDVHLGTYGCKATELLNYLHSIQPKTLILNGDIFDIWQFSTSYFPKSHMKILKYLTSSLSKGVEMYYITGNHDDMLRKFAGFELGKLKIVNKVVMTLHGKKAWFFHGDVFDVTMKHAKWLAKLGSTGYDILIHINNVANWMSQKMGRGRISLSKKIKSRVKSAVSFINNFEETAAEIAMNNGYDYVVCGHIHEPQMKTFSQDSQKVTYLNSGDWVESLTALEYHNKEWKIYHYQNDTFAQVNSANHVNSLSELEVMDLDHKQIFSSFLRESLHS